MSEEIQSVDLEQQELPEIDPAIEQEARESGWVPKDKFNGDESKWVSAEEFVERGRAINPILRKNNERLRAELANDRAELKKLKLTIDEFRSEFATMKEKAYERAIKDLKTQRKEAYKDGDFDAVEAIEEQIDEYKTQAEKAKPVEKETPSTPEPHKISEAFKEWHSENKWFNENKEPEMFDAAEGYAIRLRRQEPSLSESEFLETVTTYIRKRFPDKFANPRREAGSSVGSSGSRAEASAGKKSYASLPAEAKQACDNFVEQKIMTREQYVAEYFGD